ncbi:hypothetical protein SA45_0117 [Salmonella enterica subsp. enterica serovar Agona str. 45.E.09]|nr:hypothetical protein SA45_0117 [Salmonella enterica subsp. enterica serovar Agona str. 45.E.09]
MKAPNLPSGLSPLARGTQFFCGQRGQRLRFIPAGAGNTLMQAPLTRK